MLGPFNDIEDEQEDDEYLQQAALAATLLLGAEKARKARESHRQRLYLCRAELMPKPREDSAWQRLFKSQNDHTFITTMGVDVATFYYILDSGFTAAWGMMPIPRNDTNTYGRPRPGAHSLDAAGALGLYLHYINSSMTETSLEEIFALIPATVNRYLAFTRAILLSVLRYIPEGAIRWPCDREFNELSLLIQARHPLLNGAFGGIDGLNLPVQTADDPMIENATFNGWLHTHCTSGVFVFSPKGLIISCNLNAPGSWHDAHVARPIFNQLRDETPEGYYLVADTAFP
ncbi:hypothetical protein AcW1_007380 [Taiwanofungus camphoratus]|nr:hypothetical protein AcW2_007554 [Antrodia cinnamomea]KAI0953059.1 hypothetical protein AcW1_007380 [Antrodia cinnamomea]